MLDEFDRKILKLLQANADMPMTEIGEQVGLSHTPCWRRIKKMQEMGVIRQKVQLLNGESLGMGVVVYGYVSLKQHDEEALNAFEEAVQSVKEIVECYTTSGDKDYMLKVVVGNVSHYEMLLKKTLLHLPYTDSFSSTFALKEVKYTTELPL